MNGLEIHRKRDPGVPEALPRALGVIRERIGPERLDTLWLFPPMVQGRSERGLVVAACYAEGDQRLVHTVTYQAERTGKGLSVEAEIFEEGIAPEDRLPRMMRGVVRRTEAELGEPRDVVIAGDVDEFDKLVAECTPPEFGEGVLP